MGTRPFAFFSGQQMPLEEFRSPAVSIGASARAMARARKDDQVKVLVRFDQRINDLHCGRGIDVAVELTDREQELALQLAGLAHIRLLLVMRANGPTHPLLIPPDLIHAVIVTPAIGGTDSI